MPFHLGHIELVPCLLFSKLVLLGIISHMALHEAPIL